MTKFFTALVSAFAFVAALASTPAQAGHREEKVATALAVAALVAIASKYGERRERHHHYHGGHHPVPRHYVPTPRFHHGYVPPHHRGVETYRPYHNGGYITTRQCWWQYGQRHCRDTHVRPY